MIVAAKYSFNGGEEAVNSKYPHLLQELTDTIASIDASQFKTKQSKEARRKYSMLYNPSALNAAIRDALYERGWQKYRVQCDYPTGYYLPGYTPRGNTRGAYREMDFVKEHLGVEVQFGKYSFMVYNVAAKMTIFHKLDIIDTGVEIVPVKQLVGEMSSGVSYFEQFAWDLDQRGTSDIDIPVLILGIDAAYVPEEPIAEGPEYAEPEDSQPELPFSPK